MKNISRHVGTLRILGRLPNSKNGNPRYWLLIGDSAAGVTCQTAVDSSLAYIVPSYEGRTVEASIGTHYGKPTLNSIKLAEMKP